MSTDSDLYRTITKPSPEVLYKEKGSKFLGYAFPVVSEDEVKDYIEHLRKEHHSARHWCYAWQLGKNYDHYRANDDGEPTNSAGMPIYGQLQAFEVTNTLVVVVRYFGGTKLGVGGLIQAYKTTAKLALEASKIVAKTIDYHFLLQFEYPEMDIVMRTIKEENLKIVDQKMDLSCKLWFSIRKSESERIFKVFENTYKVDIKQVENTTSD